MSNGKHHPSKGDNMVARDIALLWIEKGLEPLPSRKADRIFKGAIKEAVDAALDPLTRAENDAIGKLPWLRAGVGEGSTVLNIQGILLLRAAMDEAQINKL